MLGMCVRDAPRVAEYLQETFVSISALKHRQAQALQTFWEARPADGLHMGRDIPSHAIAGLLNSLVVWQPVDGGRDFVVRLMGESLRARFGGYVVGRKMSDLFSEEIYAYHRHIGRKLPNEDRIEKLDVVQSYCGTDFLHYELVILPVYHPGCEQYWFVVGAFYF